MPAILRIFPYQTLASLAVIGSTDPYDQGADLPVDLYKIYKVHT